METVRMQLHKTWVKLLTSKEVPPGGRVEALLRQTLLQRAAFHLYRGEALAARAKELHKAWQAWVASREPRRHLTEDESMDWLAAELEKIDGETP